MSTVTNQFLRTYTILLLGLIYAIPAIAQQPNGCSVIAKMMPEGDSILNAQTTVLFQNASINATNYRFIINGLAYSMNQQVNMGIRVGLMTVKLVAYNGSCTDTSVSYYFYPGQFPSDTENVRRSYGQGGREHEMTGITTLGDGGNLIYGFSASSRTEGKTGLLIKAKKSGCVEWGRKIPVTYYSESSIISAKESFDGNIYLQSSISNGVKYLTKLNPLGNIIWTRGLNNGIGNNDHFSGMEVLPNGEVITVSIPSSSRSFNLTRFDNNGQIIWQRNYDLNIAWTGNFRSLLIKDNFLYIGGILGYDDQTKYGSFISKINCSNGLTVWTKKYSIGTAFITFGDMVSSDSSIVLNILGATGNSMRPTIGGIMRLDTAGTVMSTSLIAEIYITSSILGPFGAGSSRLTKSGKNYYIITAGAYPIIGLQGDGRTTKQIRLDSTLQVKWVKSSGGIGNPRYYFNAPSVNDGSIIGGVTWGPGLADFPYGQLLQVVPVDSAGGNPNALCTFYNQNWEIFSPPVTMNSVQWSVDTLNTNTSELMSLPWTNYYPEMRFNCPDYIDSCMFLKVTGPATICNLAQTYTYRSHKNKTCGQPTSWTVSPGSQIIIYTDSTITVRFPDFGRHVIYGRNMLSCVPVEDSIVIIVASTTAPVNLGNDFHICPGNSRVLHAGHWFMTYEWKDGTTDSLFTVSQPGQYWVKVTDSCNNVLSDTINVSLAPPVPLSAGDDRLICVKDTIHLSATPGFQNYRWNPPYQASSIVGQSIIVNPIIDTTYTVIAEVSPGCNGYDTIRIKVNTAPSLSLGNDKSLCYGDSLILNAGSGFNSYAWNIGVSTQHITVKQQGTYSVTATATNGCKSQDTLSVLNVFSLPALQLNHNSVLCEGDSRLLFAGSGFSQYNWSTGESTAQISANALGEYSVIVTDTNGCKGFDTARIEFIQPKPFSFLTTDISICPYESTTLKASGNYSNYSWNNGEGTASIRVSNPDLYWLQVMDQFGCLGRDSIVVSFKNDCFIGVFVPSAFTPNGDGKNDVFKPFIYGTARQYFFRIFDRWGTIVFQSTNPLQGWDGKLGGAKQNGNTFVWTLTYQLEGQPVRQLKGNVLLLK